MNLRLTIFAVLTASALIYFPREAYSGLSEAATDGRPTSFVAKGIQIADATDELAASRKKLNDAMDRANDSLRRDAEAAASKYNDAKKAAKGAADKLKQDALGLYDKYIKALKDTADSRAVVGGRAKKEFEDAKGKSDEKVATARYEDAKAAYNAVNQSITAAQYAQAKLR
jgi:hypothetical protein